MKIDYGQIHFRSCRALGNNAFLKLPNKIEHHKQTKIPLKSNVNEISFSVSPTTQLTDIVSGQT